MFDGEHRAGQGATITVVSAKAGGGGGELIWYKPHWIKQKTACDCAGGVTGPTKIELNYYEASRRWRTSKPINPQIANMRVAGSGTLVGVNSSANDTEPTNVIL